MSMYYVATRASFKEMESAVGTRVSRLNQKMAITLRKAAMSLGIKQNTRDGGRLEFYQVDQSGFTMLTDSGHKMFAVLKGAVNVRPLAWLDRDAMISAINTVNVKYGHRMDNPTHRKYLAELKATTEALLTKLEDDVVAQKPKHTNPGFAVGDMITHSGGYRETYPAVITKITEAGYQYQVYVPRDKIYRHHGAHQATQYVDSKGWGNEWDGDITIPYQANKDRFELLLKKHNRRWSTKPWCGPGQTDANYHSSWSMD